MEKLVVYNYMSFNKRYVPDLAELMEYHQKMGDVYLERFEYSEALIGPEESLKYIEDFFNKKYESHRISDAIQKIKDSIKFLREIPQYSKQAEEIGQIINSITNKQ
jgi:cell fate (sporulation/competence/biofilm development) regulator YmcA (YheA/YmcA/DUF963 family)